MSADRSEDRGLRPLADAVGGLLSNPAVLEGLIAGVSAIGASRRTKNDGEEDMLGNLLGILPQILPLLSLFVTSDPASKQSAVPSEDSVPAMAEEEEAELPPADTEPDEEPLPIPPGVFGDETDISYESPQSRRENLLLALRPFLSESRRSAADAMVQVNKLSGLLTRPKER